MMNNSASAFNANASITQSARNAIITSSVAPVALFAYSVFETLSF